MPRIETQRPPTANHRAKPKAEGSVLDRGIDVGDLETDFIKLVLYGQNRTGKTTLACEFPKPLLLVSFEPGQSGGAKSVKKVAGVTYLKVDSKADALRLAEELAAGTKFRTVVVDTVTSLQDVVLRELMNLEEAPVQLNWGTVSRDIYRERSEVTREVLRPYRDLPCHTVFVAQEKDHNPPQDGAGSKLTRGLAMESFLAADLGGATVKWLHDSCDYICRLYFAKETRVVKRNVPGVGKNPARVVEEEQETGKLVRRLLTQYHPNFAAGIRSCDPESVPEFIEGTTPEDLYEKLMAVIEGE